jgi:uncharacterized phage protein (TIGR02220 family)
LYICGVEIKNINVITKERLLKILESATDHNEAADKILSALNPKIDFDFDKFLIWFNQVTGKRIRKVDTKTKRQISQRIKDGYTKSDIAKAVKNCLSDPFHQENPHFLTPEFISREDKLVKYLNYQHKRVVLPQDWYERHLTEEQKGLLTEQQREQWYRNKAAIEMGGGFLKRSV